MATWNHTDEKRSGRAIMEQRLPRFRKRRVSTTQARVKQRSPLQYYTCFQTVAFASYERHSHDGFLRLGLVQFSRRDHLLHGGTSMIDGRPRQNLDCSGEVGKSGYSISKQLAHCLKRLGLRCLLLTVKAT